MPTLVNSREFVAWPNWTVQSSEFQWFTIVWMCIEVGVSSVIISKAANDYHFKTGQGKAATNAGRLACFRLAGYKWHPSEIAVAPPGRGTKSFFAAPLMA